MQNFSLEKVFDLLDTSSIAGSEKELAKLCDRIRELAQINGEDWVKENRQKLLYEWEYIVREGIIEK